jgi:hypothetical protein
MDDPAFANNARADFSPDDSQCYSGKDSIPIIVITSDYRETRWQRRNWISKEIAAGKSSFVPKGLPRSSRRDGEVANHDLCREKERHMRNR